MCVWGGGGGGKEGMARIVRYIGDKDEVSRGSSVAAPSLGDFICGVGFVIILPSPLLLVMS